MNSLWHQYGAQGYLSQHMDFCFPPLAPGQSWFSLVGSSGGQSSVCPPSAQVTAVLNAGAWPCKAPHGVPYLSPGLQPGHCTGLWKGLCPSLPPSLLVLWLFGQDQRRSYGTRGIDGFPLVTPVQTGGSVFGGSREQNHLCVCGVGCSRPTAVSAIAICFQPLLEVAVG